jgi:cob(I)alamin adenosyltransferase
MVNLTRIYTRTGDDGTTALGDFSRTSKNDPRLAAYADVDETNASLGVALTLGDLTPEVTEVVSRIQNELFDVGADLCTPCQDDPGAPNALRIDASYVTGLETDCDRFNDSLQPLRSFILPGGNPGTALLHQSRTISRRAERSTWAAIAELGDGVSVQPAHYLNRLSDLLFILARAANRDGDILWIPGSDRERPADEKSATE